MSEEKKKEVLDQEKNLDESEMEEVSGGRKICFELSIGSDGKPCIGMGKEEKCGCAIMGISGK